MTVFTWMQFAGATTFGCLAAASFIYAVAYVMRREKDGLDTWRLPFWVAVMWVLPLLLIGWAAWTLH